jgi:hypothetical protein
MDTRYIIQQRKDVASRDIKQYVVGCFGERDCALRPLPQSGPHEMKRIADANGIDKTEMNKIIESELTDYLTYKFKPQGSDIVGWMPENLRWQQVSKMASSLMQAIYGVRC